MVPIFQLVPLHGTVVGASGFRQAGAERATVMAKATFDLRPEGQVRRVQVDSLEEAGALVAREVYHHAERASSLRAGREVVPFLPRAGVVLRGHACAAGGQPVREMMVRMTLEREGPLVDKVVQVLGDRAPASADQPKPFTKMPLVYERAFGGPRCADNPVGTGDEPTCLALPNLVDPADAKRPVGFGPLSPHWRERRTHLRGVPLASVLTERPELPAYFDGRFFQPAPLDQQTDFLRGGENLTLEGLHPEHPMLEVRLSEATAHARVSQGGKMHSVDMFADLLLIDADRLSYSIVWRGTFDVSDGEPIKVAAAIVESGFAIQWPPELTQARVSGAPLASTPKEISVRDELTRRIREKESLEDLDLTGSDLRGFDFDGATLTSIDLSDADLRDCRMVGVNLQGARLCGADLSNADMSGADLQDADMLRAKLAGAKIGGANLATAKLSEADGPGASFDEAKLGKATLARGTWRGASFKRANMEHADLSGAELSRATFEDASLVQARLTDAKGSEANFMSARLHRVRADRARLTKCSFSRVQAEASVWEGAVLTDSCFERATLSGASFVRAELAGADFLDANMHNARLREAQACKASFREANLSAAKLQRLNAPEAQFIDAQMEGADLGQSTLTGANFTDASMVKTWLDRADLSGSSLPGVDLRKASLRSTKLRSVDLARAQLDGADLRDADLSDARMHEASTEGAKMAGANLDGVTRAPPASD